MALAQDDAPPVPTQPSGAIPAPTRIEVDERENIIRFYIEGRETMRLDAAGLHVRESVDYGGVLTDYGQDGFDNREGWKEYRRAIDSATAEGGADD